MILKINFRNFFPSFFDIAKHNSIWIFIILFIKIKSKLCLFENKVNVSRLVLIQLKLKKDWKNIVFQTRKLFIKFQKTYIWTSFIISYKVNLQNITCEPIKNFGTTRFHDKQGESLSRSLTGSVRWFSFIFLIRKSRYGRTCEPIKNFGTTRFHDKQGESLSRSLTGSVRWFSFIFLIRKSRYGRTCEPIKNFGTTRFELATPTTPR